jgi:ABC-type multidrug transport system ATPase subunit/ABC-type multidrug transport system permease subunit
MVRIIISIFFKFEFTSFFSSHSPQQNVLFPNLTVREHLRFFGRLKGLLGWNLETAIDRILLDVGLHEKKFTLSSALSGGMKRKLCLSMALIGDPKFILLDEPTSGMDVHSRRSTWELLQKYKNNRIIVLTTHFMDEADTLSDRIAIMSEGTLLCAGSSLFLKSKFGIGYMLTISKESNETPLEPISEAITSIIPPATVKSTVAGEVIYTLPLDTRMKFGELFQHLKDSSKELGIGSFGISLTTLEQVFISLAHKKLANDDGLIHDNHQLVQEFIQKAWNRVRDFFRSISRNSSSSPSSSNLALHQHSVSDIEMQIQSSSRDPNNSSNNQAMKITTGSESSPRKKKRISQVQPFLIPDEDFDNGKARAEGKNDDQSVGDEVNEFSGVNEMRTGDHTPASRQLTNFSHPGYVEVLHHEDGESPAPSPNLREASTRTDFNSRKALLSRSQKLHQDEEDEEENNETKDNKSTNGLEWEDEGVAKGHILPQFFELYKKRFIIAKRDIKGFFCQIIFPAIQILLILLILTAAINPAGHTLILNGDLFSTYSEVVTPTVLTAGAYQSSHYSPATLPYTGDLDLQRVVNASRSDDLSDYILDLSTFASNRYGGYVYDDAIKANITLDWNFIKDQLEANVNSSLTSELIKTAALTFIGENTTINLGNLQIFNGDTIQFNLTAFENFLENRFNSTNLIESIFGNQTVFEFNLPSFFNASTFRLNLTNSQLNDQIVDFIEGLPQSLNLTLPNATINLSIEIEKNGIDVIAKSPFLPNNTTELFIPWKNITYSLIEPFLPSGVHSYMFRIPSVVTIMHNSSSPHGLAAWQGEIIESIYQYCSAKYVNGNAQVHSRANHNPSISANNIVNPEDIKYLIKNHPLPITPQQTIEIRVILSLLTAIFILVPLCYIPAAFVAFIVRERVSKSKHLQFVSGISPYLYWIATYVWDLTLFLILIAFILIALSIFGKKNAKVFIGSSDGILCIISLLLTYGASSLPLAYLYSFAFVNFSTAQIVIMVINFMTGFVMVLAYYIMISIPKTQDAAAVLVHIFRFFPPYNIGEGLINLSANFYLRQVLGRNISVFSWEVTGRNLVFMLVEAVGYFMLVLLTEFSPIYDGYYWMLKKTGMLARIQPPPPEMTSKPDEDILKEEEYVSSLVSVGSAELKTRKIVLLLDHLVKTYPASLGICSFSVGNKPKFAVKGVSLACHEGERFGLLGINGAGKTTTLSILTHEISPTAGTVYIGGKSLSDPTTQRMIGYCPQVDPILELMTGNETLWFFGKIRGIDSKVLAKRVEELIRESDLTAYANVPCGNYSGGNKRKLSLAVALIGNPKVLLLDEVKRLFCTPLSFLIAISFFCKQPSTGMDPQAKRHMWNVIEKVSKNRTVILVSHSMEEIEALCTRVGVMVGGRMHCIGNNQHLKNKFGGGYLLEIRCDHSTIENCLRFCFEVALKEEKQLEVTTSDEVPELFSIQLEERHVTYFRLKVSRGMDLSKAFEEFEKNKEELKIFDYNISQFSLEQVFLNLAKENGETEEPISPNTSGRMQPPLQQQPVTQQQLPYQPTNVQLNPSPESPSGPLHQHPDHPDNRPPEEVGIISVEDDDDDLNA